MADNTRRPHEDIVAELHKRLESTLNRLSAHIGAHGMLDEREDETLAMGALALQEARDSGLIVDGGFNAMLGVVPLDDETASVADSNLVDTMIGAGIDVLERVDRDNANYVSGVTTDWDQGMVAVAVYRAMTRSSRERTYACALEIDDRGSYTEVQATSPVDAARVFALLTFHANEGEWMGGNVMVLQMPLGDGQPDLTFTVFGGRYDTTIEFPADRDPYAIATALTDRIRHQDAADVDVDVITYAHASDPDGDRFRQPRDIPAPAWAVDVRNGAED